MTSQKRQSPSSSFPLSLFNSGAEPGGFNHSANYISLEPYISQSRPEADNAFTSYARKAARFDYFSTPYGPLPGMTKQVRLRGGSGGKQRGRKGGVVGNKSARTARESRRRPAAEPKPKGPRKDWSRPPAPPAVRRATRANVKGKKVSLTQAPVEPEKAAARTLKTGKEKQKSSKPAKKGAKAGKKKLPTVPEEDGGRQGVPDYVLPCQREWPTEYRNKKPRQLPRLHNGCFMTAGLQMILNTPVVVNFVRVFHEPNHCSGRVKGRKCLRCLLKTLVLAYWVPPDPKDKNAKNELRHWMQSMYDEFYKRHTVDNEGPGSQLATNEFLMWLFEGIGDELNISEKNPSLFLSWRELFYVSFEGVSLCSKCKKENITERNENWSNFYHHVYKRWPDATPDQLFEDWFMPENYLPGPTRSCTHGEAAKTPHKLGEVTQQMRYTRFPEFFWFWPKAGIDKPSRKSAKDPFHVKDMTTLGLPEAPVWDVSRFPISGGKHSTRYRLVGVTLHKGGIDYGHYIAGVNGPDGKFFECDDLEEDIKEETRGLKGWWNIKKGDTPDDFQIDAYCFMKVTGDSKIIPDNHDLLGAEATVQQENTPSPIILQEGFLHVDSYEQEVERKEVGLFPRDILDSRHFVQVPLHFSDGQSHASVVLSGISRGSQDRPPDMKALSAAAAKTQHNFRNRFKDYQDIPFDGDLGKFFLQASKKELDSVEINTIKQRNKDLKQKNKDLEAQLEAAGVTNNRIEQSGQSGQNVTGSQSGGTLVSEKFKEQFKEFANFLSLRLQHPVNLKSEKQKLHDENDKLRKQGPSQTPHDTSNIDLEKCRQDRTKLNNIVQEKERQLVYTRKVNLDYAEELRNRKGRISRAEPTSQKQKARLKTAESTIKTVETQLTEAQATISRTKAQPATQVAQHRATPERKSHSPKNSSPKNGLRAREVAGKRAF